MELINLKTTQKQFKTDLTNEEIKINFQILITRNWLELLEALESVMCDVIKIRLKRRDATRSKIK